MTQPFFHTRGVERAAPFEQGGQRRLHASLALARRQVQDSQVFPGRPARLLLLELVVGHAEAAGREHLGAAAVVSEGARLADQPVDDVPVVDVVLAPPPQSGHLLRAPLGVEDLDPLGVQPGLDPLADEPAGHRIDVARHANRAARLDADAQPLARLQTPRRQRSQQGPLLGQPVLPPGVELTEEPLEEGGVAVAVGEVAAAAQHQRLVQGPLELAMALLDVAVLVATAGLDRLRLEPVVAQQRLVAPLEPRLTLRPGLDSCGQPVGAVQRRHAAQLPQGVLQALAEALVALREAKRAGLPVGVGQDEVVDQVLKGHAGQGDAEVGAVGEVAGGQPAGVVDLGEEDLLGRPVLGPPLLDAPLQGTQLAVVEAAGVAPLQLLEEGLGFEAGVDNHLLLDPGPDALEGVLAGPPGMRHAHLARQPGQPLVLACGMAVHAGLGRCQRQRHTLLQGLAQAQNLLVGDHRGSFLPEAAPMVSGRTQPGEF